MDTIVANCNGILVFLQALAVKTPRLEVFSLFLRADKHARGWFRRWFSHHITPLIARLAAGAYDHLGFIGDQRDVVT